MAQGRKRRTPVAVAQVKSSLLQTKALVTNRSALTAKYGVHGTARVITALQSLIASDAKRGVTSTLYEVDDAAQMNAIGARPVRAVSDEKQTKMGIDAIATNAPGAALVLIGADDVITFQHLGNPLCASGNDSDSDVPSDLPYACTAAYSTDIAEFISPTRAVTRIPDVVGGNDPRYLETCLGIATKAAPRSPRDYASALVITAAVWKGSTVNSARALFGSSVTVEESPAAGPPWAATKLARRAHFINCHGARSSSQYFGQKGQSYPIAFDAGDLPTRIVEGTVVAAECCYGAQLYDPALSALAICSTYLREGAYAFCGSTNIAYGPASSPNGYADLICQYFIDELTSGASVGDALLRARNKYVAVSGSLDPIGLKTLAQFVAYGDATLRPLRASSKRAPALAHSMPGGGRLTDAVSKTGTAPIVVGTLTGKPAPFIATQFATFAAKAGLLIGATASFESPSSPASGEVFAKSFKAAGPLRRVHIASAVEPTPAVGVPFERGVLLVAIEENGKIIGGIREVWQK